jgi:hypothetical protein
VEKGFDSFTKMPNGSEDSDDEELGVPIKKTELKNY